MAMRFTANTAYLSSTANLMPDTAITMLCWAVLQQDTNTNQVLLSFDTSGGDGYVIETAADGTTFHLHPQDAGDQTFAVQPPLRVPFAAALTYDGTTVTGYIRLPWMQRWDVVSAAKASNTPAGLSVGNFRPGATVGFRGSIWNVKMWDRALTAGQLMAESCSDDLLDASDCNRFWRMKNPGDLVDYGPRGQRRPTRNGAPQPSAWDVYVPLKRRARSVRRIPFVAPAAGGFFSRYYYDMIGQPNV